MEALACVNDFGLYELREDELMETNGGAVGCLVVGGIIVNRFSGNCGRYVSRISRRKRKTGG